MKGKNVLLGFSIHLPLGADRPEFEKAYDSRFKPLLTRIYAHPSVPVFLHFSGSALTFLEANHPEMIMLIKDIARRKQAEIIGGGISHPYFPLIPLVDRLGQIEQATTLARRVLDKRPRGCLLAGMCWEPQLASTLQAAGMDYTFLPEAAFAASGRDPRIPCVTEDQGRSVIALPAKNGLEAGIAAGAEAFVRSVVADFKGSGGVLSYVFQADRVFNAVPEAERAQALEAMFSHLSSLPEEIELSLPSRYLKSNQERGRAYFHASPLRAAIIESPTVSRLYAKMYYVHGLVNQSRGDKARKKAAREELLKAQGHEAYLASPDSRGEISALARGAAYRSLIDAEKITREKGVFMPALSSSDYDFDGYEEYLYQGIEMNAYLHRLGGCLVELDVLGSSANVCGARDAFDPAAQVLFADSFLAPPKARGSRDQEARVLREPYAVDPKDLGRSDVKLVFEGKLDAHEAIRLEKRFVFKKNGVGLSIGIVNIGTSRLSLRYANSSGFMAPQRDSVPPTFSVKGAKGEARKPESDRFETDDATSLSLVDGRGRALLDFLPENPVLSRVSGTESGGYRCEFQWDLNLAPGARFETAIQFIIHPRRGRAEE